MYIKNLFAVIFSLMATAIIAQSTLVADEKEMLAIDVAYLSSDYLEGRFTGSEGEIKAADYIASRMEALGLKPAGVNGSYFHDFEFTYKPNPHSEDGAEKKQGRNVVGMIDNGADQTIVIGAHYDHLGMGAAGSLHTGEPDIHNGADDNASGVAAILNIAYKVQHDKKARAFNYVFIGFSGEELGLFGSKNWTMDPTYPLDKITCMLNFDMVGRLNDEKAIVINGVGTSPLWKGVIEDVAEGFTVKTTESGVGASDHTSFYLKDIPAIHFFTGQHQDYHKPGDDAHLVNYEGIYEITDMVVDMIEELPTNDKMTFTKTTDAKDSRQRARFKVTLGVMPDYVFSGEGMRIDGVISGRSAEAAGMESGDVIIKIGSHEVKDIYGYMEALSKFSTGDKTEVVFMRGNEKITREVTF